MEVLLTIVEIMTATAIILFAGFLITCFMECILNNITEFKNYGNSDEDDDEFEGDPYDI